MGTRQRVRLKWTPTFEGILAGMATNMINKNLWRFTPLYDFDDLWQDAHLYFLICKDRYPEVVEPEHFTALYRTCLWNHFHALANSRSATISGLVIETESGEMDFFDQQPGRDPNEDPHADLAARLEAAPDEVKKLIEGTTRFGRPRKCKRNRNGTRETTNQFLRRLAQIDEEVDLRSMLNAVLAPS